MSKERDIELLKGEERTAGTAGLYVVLSLAVHTLLFTLWLSRQPAQVVTESPRLRYVEIAQAIPEQLPSVVEAQGAAQQIEARRNASFSNANRTAAAPEANLDGPRDRRAGTQSQLAPNEASPRNQSSQPLAAAPQAQATASPDDRLQYRVSKASAAIDWNAALKTMQSDASGGSAISQDAGANGDGGFAESAPLSFESQWYPWGDYADHMIRRIRQHWLANMPAILKTGMKGVVTIRFTIERSGRIVDITILESSGAPPFDFAARKAIELSSPLRKLPADFPGASERVTARFFYNMRKSDEKTPGRS